MKKRKTAAKRPPKDPQEIADRSAARGVPEEDLQGPPARETILMREDQLFENLGKTRSAVKVDEQNHSVDVTLYFR